MRTANGFRCFGMIILFSAGLHAADAPKDKAKQAITDISKVDADFALQGEYLGCGVDGAYRGVQVVAMGNGDFDIYALDGGLPGAGWNGSGRYKLSAKRTDGKVTAADNERRVTVENGTATWQNAAGKTLGVLEKIKRVSPTLGAAPPANAVVLFDGSKPTHLTDAKISEDGLLHVGSTTAMPVQDFHLHVEFRTPYKPLGRGQDRGNSGVYIQRRYEVQILDSFGLEGLPNECGGLYTQQRPAVNMCLPPLSWQTYDIHFTAARFDESGKNKIAPARITVYQNGEAVHLNHEIKSKTGAGKQEGPEPLPIHFQDHGNPVNFRNMWIVLSDAPATCATVSTAGCSGSSNCGTGSCAGPCKTNTCAPCREHRMRRCRCGE